MTTAMAASVFLTDVTDPLYSSFVVKPQEGFDIDVVTENYETDSCLCPGQTRNYDPYIINKCSYPIYAFIEVTLPDNGFSLTGISDDWYLMRKDANTAIYAYGTADEMTPLEGKTSDIGYTYTPMLCDGVHLDFDSVSDERRCSVIARGYAIESDNIKDKEPAAVWKTLQENLQK